MKTMVRYKHYTTTQKMLGVDARIRAVAAQFEIPEIMLRGKVDGCIDPRIAIRKSKVFSMDTEKAG